VGIDKVPGAGLRWSRGWRKTIGIAGDQPTCIK
jgi:hypothetical protein